MKEFGAFEARNRLGHLLDLIEQDEEVLITRHGREVARLIPAYHRTDRSEAHAAVNRLRARAEQSRLGPFDWSEWKTYRDDGRR